MNNCGISRWDDPKEINAQLKALTDQPIWEVTDEYYNNVILKYYDERCTQSRAVYEESQKYIPGGVQHNLAFNKPFPMCMAKAEGAYLYDKDGNKYIDFLQAGGPTILGSNYPVIREKVFQLLNECGPVTGLLHESEMLIAREINRHMPNVEMFRMLGSIVHLECTGAMSFDFSSMSFLKSAVGLLRNKDMMYVRKDSMERMGAAYMANGIVTLAGSRLYTSMADTPEIIDEALNRFEEVFKHVAKTDKGLVK